MTATIETSGALTTPHYVSTDHLTGSNVVTNSSGAQEELMDYYPFGGIRLDEKTGTFSEQRKFTSYEYDTDTGLNYANARYQHPTQGRFISQDPVFWSISEELLADPQQLNSYSYARNNPLVGIDPSGLYTIEVPGTWNEYDNWTNSDAGKAFQDSVSKTFNETHKTEVFQWSGDDNDFARRSAAADIVANINNYKFADGEQLNIIGHSHGGNIGILVSQMTDRKIDNLVTLGTPVRSDYQPNYNMIDRHINAYSNLDFAQTIGGGQFSVAGFLGRIIGKQKGARIGDALGWGEFGFAGRKFNGADNINVSVQSFSLNPKQIHSNMWQKQSVWAKVDSLFSGL